VKHRTALVVVAGVLLMVAAALSPTVSLLALPLGARA